MAVIASEAIYRFPSLDSPGLLHGVAGRAGGVSAPPFDSLNLSIKTGDDLDRVEQNRRRFEHAMSIETRQVTFGRLTHGREVTVFRLGDILPSVSPPSLGWPMFDSDAAISNVPGLVLVMTFADCVPILLWDPRHQACGLAHAGWKGTALRIGSTAVTAMAKAFGSDPADLTAGIAPSIAQSCYPVGSNVRTAFSDAFGSDAGAFFENDRLDLWAANTFDLVSAGLKPENILVSGICTACRTDAYFSHRAEHGHTGRFGACIGVRYPGRFADSDEKSSW